MRHIFVTLCLAACSSEPSAPTPPVRCTPGTVEACACAMGSGTRSCLADSTFGGCLCPRPDAGSMDAPSVSDVPCGGLCGAGTVCEGGRCVGADAGAADAAVTDVLDVSDANERCTPRTLTLCVRPGFGDSCIDTQTNAMHCGACNSPCPASASECVAGRCTVPRDAGP